MKPPRQMTTGDHMAMRVTVALAAWGLAASFAAAAASAPASAPAAPPTMGLFSSAESGMVVGSAEADVYVKLFSWDDVEGPLEVRYWLVDWSGQAGERQSMDARISGLWARQLHLKLPRYGPYKLHAELHRKGGDKPLRSAEVSLVRVVALPVLTPEQRAGSYIGVNTHFNAPWKAFEKMGIHWARDYCWGWLEYGQSAPMAGNSVDFRRIFADSQAAHITVLPCMSAVHRTEDKKRFIADTAKLRDAYEKLAKAFPTVPIWEMDNEIDLQFHSTTAGYEEWMASYVPAIQAAAEGLRKAGTGAKLALNGDAGIYPDRAARLLAGPAKDDFICTNSHFYTGTVPPELSKQDYNTGAENIHRPSTFLDELRRISRVSHEHGKQSWLTEVGWDVTYGPAVGERLQALYLARMYLLSRFCSVDKTFWFYDRDIPKGTGIFASSGLLDLSLSARPSAAALAVVSKLTALAPYGGSIDLGGDRWCLLFGDGDGKWLAAAWSVQADYPLPAELKGVKAVDLFGNEFAPEKLTPEVAYFSLDALPAGWDAQRRAELLSPTLVEAYPGGTVAMDIRLPAGAKLTWENMPAGVTNELAPRESRGANSAASAPAGAGSGAEFVRTTLTFPPNLPIGRHALTAVAAGEGWKRAWPLTISVVGPLEAASEPYWPGKPAKLTIRPHGDKAEDVTLDLPAEAGAISPAKLAVPPAGASTVFTAADKAAGPVRLTARLASGASQVIFLRQGFLTVPMAGQIKLDGKLDDWPAGALLPEGTFDAFPAGIGAKFYLAWSPQGLYLAACMPDKDRRPSVVKEFWEWTNVELFVDGSGGEHAGWPKSSHQFWFMPAMKADRWFTAAGEWKRSDAIPQTLYDDARGKTGIDVAAETMTMEVFIPAEALGAAPKAGAVWRAALTGQITRRHESNALLAWPRTKRDGVLDGSKAWGELRFVDGGGK
jgi:hypothetical protein